MKIGDFAAKSGLSADTLRYYERIGLLPRTVRDAGGRRSYGMDDLAWAAFLRKLQAMDMPMRDRLEYSRLRAEGDATLRKRRAMLEAHRDALIARQIELAELVATLDAKIDQYIDMESQAQGKPNYGGQTHDDRGSGIAPSRQRSSRGASGRA